MNKFYNLIKRNEIVRRYIIINSFDGTLTVLGIILAEFIIGTRDPKIIILPIIGAGIAMCISGIWGAYFAELAESKRYLENLEKHLIRDLDGTKIDKKMKKETLLVALVDGFSPLLVSLVLISPFIFFNKYSYYISFLISIVVLFILGFFVGSIARENKILYGVKMLASGVFIAFIFYILAMFGLF